jgi:hypothetical protein
LLVVETVNLLEGFFYQTHATMVDRSCLLVGPDEDESEEEEKGTNDESTYY